MSSQRLGRHQRRASQSVFALPENFAALDDVPASDEHRKASSPDGGAAEQQQQRPASGRHRRAMSMAIASSRDLEMIKEDIGSYSNYKIGA